MSCSRTREAASSSSRATRRGFELRSDRTRRRPFGRGGVEIGASEALLSKQTKLTGINRPLGWSFLMGAGSHRYSDPKPADLARPAGFTSSCGVDDQAEYRGESCECAFVFRCLSSFDAGKITHG